MKTEYEHIRFEPDDCGNYEVMGMPELESAGWVDREAGEWLLSPNGYCFTAYELADIVAFMIQLIEKEEANCGRVH